MTRYEIRAGDKLVEYGVGGDHVYDIFIIRRYAAGRCEVEIEGDVVLTSERAIQANLRTGRWVRDGEAPRVFDVASAELASEAYKDWDEGDAS